MRGGCEEGRKGRRGRFCEMPAGGPWDKERRLSGRRNKSHLPLARKRLPAADLVRDMTS
jgi:hypothetical protein